MDIKESSMDLKSKQKACLYLTIASTIMPLHEIPIYDIDESSPTYILFNRARKLLTKWMIIPPTSFELFLSKNQKKIFNCDESLYNQEVDYKNNIIIFPDDIDKDKWFARFGTK